MHSDHLPPGSNRMRPTVVPLIRTSSIFVLSGVRVSSGESNRVPPRPVPRPHGRSDRTPRDLQLGSQTGNHDNPGVTQRVHTRCRTFDAPKTRAHLLALSAAESASASDRFACWLVLTPRTDLLVRPRCSRQSARQFDGISNPISAVPCHTRNRQMAEHHRNLLPISKVPPAGIEPAHAV
jgi:hypothetical protein